MTSRPAAAQQHQAAQVLCRVCDRIDREYAHPLDVATPRADPAGN